VFQHNNTRSSFFHRNTIIPTMNINQETGEIMDQGRSPRFKLWISFLVFSTVTLVSAVGVVREASLRFSFCHGRVPALVAGAKRLVRTRLTLPLVLPIFHFRFVSLCCVVNRKRAREMRAAMPSGPSRAAPLRSPSRE